MFSPDSHFMRFMSRLADLMLLNILFLITSLPIVTIGASSTALYTVCFRMDTVREGRLTRDYFRAFRAEFKQSTLLWLVMVLCFSGCTASTALFSRLAGPLRYALLPCAALAFISLMMLTYVFPLQSQFENSLRDTLKNAMVLSIAHLPRSILIAGITAFPAALLFLDPVLFLQTGFLWVALYFSAGAYCVARLLRKVFAPYLTHEEDNT